MRVLRVCLVFLIIFFLQVCKDPESTEARDLVLIQLIDNYPNLEKGACPGNEVVNIFPPGTHSVNLTAGERYYFNLTIAYGGVTFEISYNEDPGTDIAALTLGCAGMPGANPSPAEEDSGMSGQNENILIYLNVNYPRRLGVLVSDADTTTNLILPSVKYSN